MNFENKQNNNEPFGELSQEEALRLSKNLEDERQMDVNPDPEGIRDVLREFGLISAEDDEEEVA